MKVDTEEIGVGKAILLLIGAVLLGIILTALGLMISMTVGYLFGMLFVLIPFTADILTSTLPITESQVPSLTAWVFLIGSILAVGSSKKITDKS